MDYIIKLATQEGHQNKCEVSSILNMCIKGLLSHGTIWWPEEGSKISFFKSGDFFSFFKRNLHEMSIKTGLASQAYSYEFIGLIQKIMVWAENFWNWTFFTINY